MKQKMVLILALLCTVVLGAWADQSETIETRWNTPGLKTFSSEHFELKASVDNLHMAYLNKESSTKATLTSKGEEVITSVAISFVNNDDAQYFLWGNSDINCSMNGNVCTISNVNNKQLTISTNHWAPVWFYSITIYYTYVKTVTYDGNGNTGGTIPEMTYKFPDRNLTLSSNVLTRSGYIHDGWAISSNGPKVFNFGAIYKDDADLTLYAHWTPDGVLTNGDGTATNPYLISSSADWDQFAANVATGNNYSSKYVKLNANISVDWMVGTSEHPFSGIFLNEGNHSLTFTKGSYEQPFDEEYCAPFRYVSNATIQSLDVRGDIYTTRKFAAGLVACGGGTTNIENCRVGTVIHSLVTTNEGSHGGFVAMPGGTLNITGCTYTGRLLSVQPNTTTNCSGFVGWRDDKTITITHSLYAPVPNKASGNEEQISRGCATFVRGGSVGAGCYYTEAMGEAQGLQVYTTASDGEIWMPITAADGIKYYLPCTISGVTNYQYTGSAITIVPTVTASDGTVFTVGTDYTYAIAPTLVQEPGDYTLTISGKGSCTGTKTINFSVAGTPPLTNTSSTLNSGTYMLYSDLQFDERITINGTVTLILGSEVKLTAKKGIELSEGNTLTIDGPGYLTINECDREKSGIGAVKVGTLVINGGIIDIKAGVGGAGIGGDEDNTSGGSITINGGIVNITADLFGAGIGGGSFYNNKAAGVCGDIVINGGQINISNQWYGASIGPGGGLLFILLPERNPHDSGTLTLGWTNPDDFIQAKSYKSGDGCLLKSITFAEGKAFLLDGTETLATVDNISDKKIVPCLALGDHADNSGLLSQYDGQKLPVTLNGRTLYKDGKWNTICLPFDVTISESPLKGAEARPLTNASISGMMLNLTFGDPVATLAAGTPYIIKWDSGDNIVSPLFSKVAISTAKHDYDTNNTGVATDQRVRFVGTYKSTTFDSDDMSILLMGGSNTLYYPGSGAGIGTQRAYFKIGNDSGARVTTRIQSFSIDYGNGDNTTGIFSLNSAPTPDGEESWYTIEGRRLTGKPTTRGIYINNGRKIVIK